jgi:hypothetical protein
MVATSVIRAVLLQETHRFHVERVGGAPERRGALHVDAAPSEHAERVLHVPEMPVQARIRVRARLEQRAHHLDVRRLLLAVLHRMGIRRPGLPLPLQNGVERRRAGDAGLVRVGSVLEEHLREVPLAVDGRHQQGRREVAARRLMSAPPSRSASVASRWPCRTAWSNGVSPPQRSTCSAYDSALFDLHSLPLPRLPPRRAPLRRLLVLRPRPSRRAIALHLAGQLDRGLDLAGVGCQSEPPPSLLTELVEGIGEAARGSLIGRRPLGDVHRAGRHVRIGARGEEHANRLGTVVRRGEDQRRLAPGALGDVRIDTPLEERGNDLGITRRRRQVERCGAPLFVVRAAGFGPPAGAATRRRAWPDARRCATACSARSGAGIDVRAGVEQHAWRARRHHARRPNGARSSRRPAPRSRRTPRTSARTASTSPRIAASATGVREVLPRRTSPGPTQERLHRRPILVLMGDPNSRSRGTKG